MARMREAVYAAFDGKRLGNFLIEIVEVECGTAYGSVTDTTAKQQSISFNFTSSREKMLEPRTVSAIFSALEDAINRKLTQVELNFS
jgi:hypothetical protein